MDFIRYAQETPKKSGKYLIQISKQREFGVDNFNYVAYYDYDTDKWYQYEPFQMQKGDEITDTVVVWMKIEDTYH